MYALPRQSLSTSTPLRHCLTISRDAVVNSAEKENDLHNWDSWVYNLLTLGLRVHTVGAFFLLGHSRNQGFLEPLESLAGWVLIRSCRMTGDGRDTQCEDQKSKCNHLSLLSLSMFTLAFFPTQVSNLLGWIFGLHFHIWSMFCYCFCQCTDDQF